MLNHTSFRIRILTKNAVVGKPEWVEFFKSHPGRFVIGLSTGTTDDQWARRVELGTSPPSSRLNALRSLQKAGVPTYGMLCPIFPDMMAAGNLDALIKTINPGKVEHIWAEPYNDRQNWRTVRGGDAKGSAGYDWMTQVYEQGDAREWSLYAGRLYLELRRRAERGKWLGKLGSPVIPVVSPIDCGLRMRVVNPDSNSRFRKLGVRCIVSGCHVTISNYKRKSPSMT